MSEGSNKAGLQHVPTATGATLALGGSRSSLFARGRRDAADAAANPHYREGRAAFETGNYTSAAGHFRLAAEQGHAESQYMLSTMYDEGQGIERDDALSSYWERKAAEQGHAYAQANLSFRYYATNQFDEAFSWCLRAADSNLAWAQYNVGLMYGKGEGVEQSHAEAAHWYRLAALQNFTEAQQKLGDLYYFGLGVPQSYEQAATWYRKAADRGNAEAQFQLGHLYATGQGVETDYVQSRHWIRQAAKQGHEQALREFNRRSYRDA